MPAKKDDTNEGAFTRIFRILFIYNFHCEGKITSWVEVVTMTHFSANRKDIQFFAQVIQALTFSFAHCFIFLFISHIFVYAGREQL